MHVLRGTEFPSPSGKQKTPLFDISSDCQPECNVGVSFGHRGCGLAATKWLLFDSDHDYCVRLSSNIDHQESSIVTQLGAQKEKVDLAEESSGINDSAASKYLNKR